MPVTRDQADMLATLAAAARPHGARRWDAPGIVAAIGKVKHLALADVALAVIRAADDRSLDTPGAIGNTRASCWQERATARPTTRDNPDKAHRCSVCSLSEDRCRALWSDDHDFAAATRDRKRSPEQMAAIAQATKAELQPTAEPDPPREHKPDPRAAEARAALAADESDPA